MYKAVFRIRIHLIGIHPSLQASGSGSRVMMSKIEKNLLLKKKPTNYLSLSLHKGFLSYRRSLQPSKENIQHFKT
jgi:hypothetical protein